jgi:HD-GYP domain-containing protein (c-di-GMP phosphodiesterase class II)
MNLSAAYTDVSHEELCTRLQTLEHERLEILGELEEAYERLGVSVLASRQEADLLYGELREKMIALERRIYELTTLARAARSISSVLRLDPLLESIVDQAKHLTDAESSALFLQSDDRGLAYRAGRGVRYSVGSRSHFGADALKLVQGTDRPVFLDELDLAERWAMMRLDPHIRSEVILPLQAHGTTIGMLVLGSSRRGAFLLDQESLLSTFAVQCSVAITNARLYHDLEKLLIGVLMSLATALEAKDSYTEGHSSRVAWYAVLIGKEMGLAPEELENVHRAGLIHDIGKIGVGGSIIRKEGALTEDEWQKMRMHPLVGADIISSIELLAPALPGVRQHHERWDGTGYPDGLKGTEIPLIARILAVADAYDALTTDRSYRRGRSPELALEELKRSAGTQFDPSVIAALERCFPDVVETERERTNE